MSKEASNQESTMSGVKQFFEAFQMMKVFQDEDPSITPITFTEQLSDLITKLEAHLDETDAYKKALVQRIIYTLNSIKVIWEHERFIDVLALLRTVLDCAARLHQYHIDKDSITKQKKDAFKILGTGSGIQFTAEKISEAGFFIRLINAFLSDFIHPGLISLIFTEAEQEEEARLILELTAQVSIPVIELVLSKTYEDFEIEENIMLFTFMCQAVDIADKLSKLPQKQLLDPEQLEWFKNEDVFASSQVGKFMRESLEAALDNPEQMKEVFGNFFNLNFDSEIDEV